jgi:hypothetical protein
MEVPFPTTDKPPNREAKKPATGKTETTGTTKPSAKPSDSPPRKRTERADGTAKARAPLEDRLAEFLGAASLPFAVAGDQYSAQIIATRTPQLAHALAELARENRAIDRMLQRLLEGSAWGGVAIATVAIILPIAQSYNLAPGADPFAFIYPPIPGAPSPGMAGWTRDAAPGGEPTPTASPGASTNGGTPPATPSMPGAEAKPPKDVPIVEGSPPGVVTVPPHAHS